jgi:hypothetical protein
MRLVCSLSAGRQIAKLRLAFLGDGTRAIARSGEGRGRTVESDLFGSGLEGDQETVSGGGVNPTVGGEVERRAALRTGLHRMTLA